MKLLLTGDYFYDYSDKQEDFDNIKKEFNNVDISILNYEGSFKSDSTIKKAVNLSMSDESLKFDNKMLFCLANNHILDYDLDGCLKTISNIINNGFDYFGLESSKNKFDNYKIIEQDGICICIGSFGWANEECILSGDNIQGNVNLTKKNMELFFDSIEDVVYDKLLIYVHYGYEYEYYPLPLHVDLFRYIIDLGADFVYSSHSHILQPYEIYNNKYIFYGLGNFYFASRRDLYPESSDLGLYLELDINKSKIIVSPKYIKYDRQLRQSIIQKECNYFLEHKLNIKSFKQYSKAYSKTRIRKKNPRPILYKDSDFTNSFKFKGWKLIVDITGFLKIRQLVKKILGW